MRYGANFRQRGMTLTETIVAVAIWLFATLGLLNYLLPAGRLVARIDDASTSANQIGNAFNKIVLDMQSGDAILSRWPLSGTAQFTAGNNGALIIRIPRMDSNGLPVANQFDIAIYTGMQTGANQSELRRQTSTLINGSAGTLSRVNVLAKNITNWNLTFIGLDRFQGNGTQNTFTLEGSYASTVPSPIREARIGGNEFVASSAATLSGNRLTFTVSPANNAEVEATYSLDPAVSQTSGVVAAGGVFLQCEGNFTRRTSGNNVTNFVRSYQTRAMLRNR